MAAVAGGGHSGPPARDPLEDEELQSIIEQQRESDSVLSSELRDQSFQFEIRSSVYPTPTGEVEYYQKIDTCLRHYIRTSSMFRPAKAILNNAMLKIRYGIPTDLDALKIDLMKQGLYEIPSKRTGVIAIFSYSQDVTYGVTSDEELRRLKESEIEDFLRDRLVIVLKSSLSEEATYELCLDRPDFDLERLSLTTSE